MIHLYILPLYVAFLFIVSVFIIEIKIKSKCKRADASFETLISILTLIVNTEITVYEHSLFREKAAITNSNYENFYNDICNAIFKSIPEEFYQQITHYITKEGVAEIICQLVQDYLQSKVNLVFKGDKEKGK